VAGARAAYGREIEDLKAVVRQAGDSAFVFGSSSGAALAMQGVAAGLPIRKLVLYEPASAAQPQTTPPPEEARRRLDALVAAGGVVALIFLGGAIALVVWWRRRKARVQRVGAMRDQAEAES